MNQNAFKALKRFKTGAILHASDLNSINETVFLIAKKANIQLRSRPSWTSGAILTAASLNNLLQDVEQLFSGMGYEKIEWSFGKFKDGTVLKAEHLNEIVDKIEQCLKRATD